MAIKAFAAVLVAAALTLFAPASPASADEAVVSVEHTAVTTERGTPHQTYYDGTWDSNSRIHWANTGAFLEVVFDGHTAVIYGSTRTGHGLGRVSIDDQEKGTVTYGAATNNTVRALATFGGLTDGRHTLRIVAEGWVDHGRIEVTSGQPHVPDALETLHSSVSGFTAADYTAPTWDPFAVARTAAGELGRSEGTPEVRETARAALQQATDALVLLRGIRAIVADYQNRVPTDFTRSSWTPFATALNDAKDLLDRADATKADVVRVKNGLHTTAGALVPVAGGSFQPITNNTFWRDTDGNPIYSQGGGIFRFGDTYYWYGVRYANADDYHADPSHTYPSAFQSIPVYSSKDLVNWTFENEVATTGTALNIPASTGPYWARLQSLAEASWLGRLGVSYNENTGKYVLLVQMSQRLDPSGADNAGVLFLQGDSPADDFAYANLQKQIVNSPTRSTGDQTVFTDDDGSDYLVFSNAAGRARAFVSKISAADSLTVEPGAQIGWSAAGREGNAMFRLHDTYYMAASDLHGWNTSVNHVIQSQTSAIQGPYSPEYTLRGTEKDYSHVTQTGFFVTIKGTKQNTVLYAGDRWADFAWNGLGYNQWTPLSETGDGLFFNSLSHWELNAVTGEWRVGDDNNYVLNPDFAADRIARSELTGWTTTVDTEYSANTFVKNVTPGADSSRWALQLGNAEAFSGSVRQENPVPDGLYTFKAKINTGGALGYARVVISDASGHEYHLDVNRATSGWEPVELRDIVLTGGTATVRVEARSAGGNQSVKLDLLSLVKLPDWSPDTTYLAGATVHHQGSRWRATWWTRGQAPGDPHGPWQEIKESAGTAVWTPSRIFVAGDVALHQGVTYTAKWWTRNQQPGNPYGPWQVTG
ncbi:chitodextrinase [Actinoplanes lutulentus]|uniref:Carbohydrate binding protein n=1 Tax=Actinoplanes lutulentus TaxID=1287878 RepID=A0A327ZGD5_9ACTN|nr:carbohydrate-binding protein [Actinoplanes lutulentus]MBB2947309.1 chitodextrinase [Actinoplanes lutulentus]RAK36584.1 carbohydrate binding protein [Actinoplanes lutulentus]